jgi:hypothetical protein
MSAESAIWDLIRQLIGIGRTAANQAAGLVSLVGLAGEPRSGPSCALPGHYGVLKSSRNVVFIRTGRGAIVLGYITTPPDGAQAGDAGIVTDDGLHLRLREKKLQVTGSDAVDGIDLDGGASGKKIVRHGDNVPPTVAEALWKSKAAAVLNALVAGTVEVAVDPIGTTSASTTKVKAG